MIEDEIFEVDEYKYYSTLCFIFQIYYSINVIIYFF